MTGPEIKPGKWRLADGREVVVLWRRTDRHVQIIDGVGPAAISAERFEGAEYLGPAVIGESKPFDARYWMNRANEAEQQCKQLEAETVATRELLEKAEERCEELARELEESDEAFRRRAQNADSSEHGDAQAQFDIAVLRDVINSLSCENRRLKRGELTPEEFQELCHGLSEDDMAKFKEGCITYWEKIAGPQGVKYSWDDGIETWRFVDITVLRQGTVEAMCGTFPGGWRSLVVGKGGKDFATREEAETWCRKQLEPKWREAGEGDVGKACRVKDLKSDDWERYEQLYAVIDHDFRFLAGDPDDPGTTPQLYAFCEVQE